MNRPASRDRPKVKVMPPLVFVAFLIGAGLLEFGLPAGSGGGWLGLRRLIAWLLLLFAGYLALSSWMMFLKSGTHVDPRKPALKIIEDGPFRISRNPMYLSLVIILAALSILHLSIWFLLRIMAHPGPQSSWARRGLLGGKVRRMLQGVQVARSPLDMTRRAAWQT